MKKEHSNTVIIIAVVALVIMILIMMAPNISIGASSANTGFSNPFAGNVMQQPALVPISSAYVAAPIQQPANPEVSQTQNLNNEPNFTGNWGNPNAPQLQYQ